MCRPIGIGTPLLSVAPRSEQVYSSRQSNTGSSGGHPTEPDEKINITIIAINIVKLVIAKPILCPEAETTLIWIIACRSVLFGKKGSADLTTASADRRIPPMTPHTPRSSRAAAVLIIGFYLYVASISSRTRMCQEKFGKLQKIRLGHPEYCIYGYELSYDIDKWR